MYYCYIVRCADKTLYTGMTTNLARRLKEHNAGKGARPLGGTLPPLDPKKRTTDLRERREQLAAYAERAFGFETSATGKSAKSVR